MVASGGRYRGVITFRHIINTVRSNGPVGGPVIRRDSPAYPSAFRRPRAPRVVIAGHGNHFLLLNLPRQASQRPAWPPGHSWPVKARTCLALTLPGTLAARPPDALLPDELNV